MARWVAIAISLVVVIAAVLVLLMARGSTGGSTAGRPVPAPEGDPFSAGSGGVAPRPGELVISLPSEQVENARLETTVVTGATGSLAEPSGIRTTGTVQANAYKEVPVFPVLGGIVREVSVELGDRVGRGQRLASVFSSDLAEAQANYLSMLAETEQHHQHYQRTIELVELGAASREELEAATAMSKSERAKLNSMRERLELLGLTKKEIDELRSADQIRSMVQIMAPAGGTLLARNVNTGEVIMSGKELFRIADLSSVWVIGQVFEKDLAEVRVGSRAQVTAPAYQSREFPGRVSYIDPRVDAQTRTAQVRIEVANPGVMLKLGMFVDVNFGAVSGSRTAALLVPGSAVQQIGSKRVVYVVSDRPGSFVQRDVMTGPERDGQIEILDGVSPGEKVVTEGSFLLRAESLKLHPNQNTSIAGPAPGPDRPVTEPAREQTAIEPDASQTARVRITDKGYEPATIRLRKGVNARITFVREVEATCGTDVHIDEFGITKELPFKEPVVVEFTPSRTGEYAFTCGMKMLRGKIIVR
jgi:RND family efflux transporter MFP subunit